MADTTETTPVWDPDRKDIVDVPKEMAQKLVATGYHYKMGDDAERENTDINGLGMPLAASHSFINSLGFGLPDLAASTYAKYAPTMLGGDAVGSALKRVHKQESDHSYAAAIGEAAGYFGPGGLLTVGGKALEKAGVHSALEYVAKHTPQAYLEHLGKEQATKYAYGETAKRLAGKAGSAAGVAAEMAAREGAEEVSNENLYDDKYSVEKIAQAIGWGGLVGGAADLGLGIAGEGVRGLRKGISKTADFLEEKVVPSKMKKDGKIQVGEKDVGSVIHKRVKRTTTKESTKVKTGGGWEKGQTHVKAYEKEEASTDTLAQTENTITDHYDKKEETKPNTTPPTKVTFKENIYANQPEEAGKRETPLGFQWEKGAKKEDILASIRTQMDAVAGKTATGKDVSRHIIQLEADIKQAFEQGRPGDAQRLIHEKEDWHKVMAENHPDWKPLHDEYFNVMNGHYDTFDPTKEFEGKKPVKVGTKTTVETPGQPPKTTIKENTTADSKNYTLDQEQTKQKTIKEALDEEKTQRHSLLDSEETAHETVVHNDEYQAFHKVKLKPEYQQLYRKEFMSPIAWQARYGIAYAAHTAGVGSFVTPLLAADYALPHVLNNRSFYSKQLDRISKPVLNATGKLVKNLTTSVINRETGPQAELTKMLKNPDKHYAAVVKRSQEIAGDPGAAQQAVQGNWQHALGEHPQLQTGLILHAQTAAQAMQAHIPPDIRPPTAQHTPYNPPRSQKVKFLRLYHAINNPLAAMDNPTPQQIGAIELTSPETLALVRRAIAGHIAQGGEPFKGKAAQDVSIILGQAINTRNDSGYLKRMQATASLDAPPTAPSGGNMQGPHAGSIAGPKSAKVQQDAAMLYATPQQLHELG